MPKKVKKLKARSKDFDDPFQNSQDMEIVDDGELFGAQSLRLLREKCPIICFQHLYKMALL